MNMSFYTGAIGADACLNKLSVVSNNLANVNTYGFKPKTAVFEELLNYNLNEAREPVTELQAGASVASSRTSRDFYVSTFHATNSFMDFALGDNNTFFMLQDPDTQEISYTRNGHFHAASMEGGDELFLMTESGKYVLDQNRQPLRVGGGIVGGYAEGQEGDPLDAPRLAVYTMTYPSRLLNMGDNEYRIREGDEQNNAVRLVQNPYLQGHAVELSATDMAREMTRMIETQRAFTYAIKMVTTSDEAEQTVNQLRQ